MGVMNPIWGRMPVSRSKEGRGEAGWVKVPVRMGQGTSQEGGG